MKAISKASRHASIMHIESKLSGSSAQRIDLAAGGVPHREFAGKSRSLNITTMRTIDAIGGSN
jgi:hypothetical protein